MHASRRTRSLGALLATGTAIAMIAPVIPAQATASNTWSDKSAPLATPWTAQVSPTNALPDYPRPQLARPSVTKPTWLSLNGLWEYQPSDGYTPPTFGQKLSGQILVPFPAESALSGVMEHADFMLYRRTVTVPASYRRDKQHLQLRFGAVNYAATVWVNGTKLAVHTGAYEAFSVDITRALRKKGPQEIVVGVASPVDSEDIPVGKQRLDPDGIFYTAASGIWQSVWLEPVAPTSLETFTATPNRDLKSFTVSAAVDGPAKNAKISVKAYAGKKKVGSVSGKATGRLRLKIKNPRLWSPEDPFLYTFKVTLKRGKSVDKVESYAGLRTIGLAKVDGKQRIVLNGKPTFVLATLDQGYWPDGIYTAPTDEALRFDIARTKDLGFNTIRKHIKVEPARWYYWADRLGMLVWQDQPALPTGRNDRLSSTDKANLRSETARMVDQLKGVTSIIGWVPFNEGWGQWSVQAAADLGDQVKKQDPTRLVDSRSGSNCCDTPGDPGNGDVIDFHQYQGPALPAPDAKRASIDGEHGGLTLSVPGHLWPTASINPYGAVKDEAELNDKYVANNDDLRDLGARNGLSGGVYTQITDVEGEQNGFFTYDRQVLKVDEARVRASNLSVIKAGSQPAPQPPPGTPGLGGVGHWTLDEGQGTTAADTVGDNPLTLRNGATWVAGPTADAKTALHLTGEQFADTAATVVPTRGTNFSVSAWVRLDSADGAFQTVVSEDGDTNSAFFLQYSGADRRWAFSFVGARALVTDLGEPKTGQWYHLVGVRDTTASTLTLYVDGALAGTTRVLATPDTATGVLAVGRGQFGGKPVDYLNGSVDDVRVFDRALSAAEVAELEEAGAQ